MIVESDFDQFTQIIPLHFNVEEHSLSLDVFIHTAQDTKIIIENFNKEFFEGKLKYKIIVLPPAAGTFKSKLKIITIAGTLTWGAVNSEVGSALIKGLTGHSSADWAEKIGEIIHKQASQAHEYLEKEIASIILSESTKGFLQKSPGVLEEIGISKINYRNAYEARNNFYEICLNDPEIKGIGFDDSSDFPIKRADFPQFIISLPPEEESKEGDWFVEFKSIVVTSPNWERGDERWWKGKSEGNKHVFFTIEDDFFWQLVHKNKLKPRIFDRLRVQWAYHIHDGRMKDGKVLRVLEYNEVKISEMLTDEELDIILENYSHPQESDQGDLFSTNQTTSP